MLVTRGLKLSFASIQHEPPFLSKYPDSSFSYSNSVWSESIVLGISKVSNIVFQALFLARKSHEVRDCAISLLLALRIRVVPSRYY